MNNRRTIKRTRTLPRRFRPLAPRTVLFAILALSICVGVSAIVIQRVHNTSKQSPSTSSSSTQSPMPNVQPVDPNGITTQNTTQSNTSSNQSAVEPVTCNGNEANTLRLQEKNADSVFVSTTKTILSQQSSLSDAEAVNKLNGAILLDNDTYTTAYASYVHTEQTINCPISVSQRASLPLCYPAKLDSFSVTSCIANIHLGD